MDSTRQLKVSRLIQKELSFVFQKDGQWIYGAYLVSITDVRVSPDLSVSRIQLSVFPVDGRENVVNLINDNTAKLRHELAVRVKNQMRKVPDLYFYLDDSFDRMERIDQLLKK
jgi:ribosome-binding factor A